MAHRINERNAGHWTLDGEPKTRRTRQKPQPITDEEKRFAAEILERVYSVMEFNPKISERGHIHPDATFTDGGRFIMSMTRAQYESLFIIIEKMGGFNG